MCFDGVCYSQMCLISLSKHKSRKKSLSNPGKKETLIKGAAGQIKGGKIRCFIFMSKSPNFKNKARNTIAAALRIECETREVSDLETYTSLSEPIIKTSSPNVKINMHLGYVSVIDRNDDKLNMCLVLKCLI